MERVRDVCPEQPTFGVCSELYQVADQVEEARQDDSLALVDVSVHLGPQEDPDESMLPGAVWLELADEGEFVERDA